PLAADLAAGRAALVLPSREALDSASGEQLSEWLKSMGGSYAYRVGYFDADGDYQEVMFTGDSQSPLMADAPGLAPHGVQSINHPGGQNVLDQGLSVRFRTKVLNGDRDHIFLNIEGEHAAGLGPKDIALIRSEYTPKGRLVPVDAD
ncbi:MAG TPA: hypothetical protein VF175_05010, partial [Lacipirellula sp.]